MTRLANVVHSTIKYKGPYLYQGFPLIRMNSAIVLAFLHPAMRRQMAKNWLKKHGRQGVGLCNPLLDLIGYIRPDGSVHEVQPPFVRFEMWQMSNAPRVHTESEQACACAGFYDPEVGGPWRERGLPAHHHHPFCQFARSAVPVFGQAHEQATARLKARQAPQARPDEWLRLQLEKEG